MKNYHTFEFIWNSYLGFSTIIFLTMNFIYFLMGTIPPLIFRKMGKFLSLKFGFVFSPRTDEIAFGEATENVLQSNPKALIIKTSVYDMISGLYLAFSMVHFCLIYFCLTHGEKWAFWAISFSNSVIFIYYLMAAKNYSVKIAKLKFADLMPFATIPGILLPVAIILGYLGLY
ncbi:MAG: hypothetical protein KG003_02760 [Bacteroidetes bacterium]|nr:hypothetical protein [Bacteroidota bacterium]